MLKYILSAGLIIGLLMIFSLRDGMSQQLMDTASDPFFYFPMEEGNVWVYRDRQYPSCLGSAGYGCIFVRLEVAESFNEQIRTCSVFKQESYEMIYPPAGPQTRNFRELYFQLCQEDSRLYWFDEETNIEANFPDRDMIADFSRDETQPWMLEYFEDNPDFPYTLRRLTEKSASEPYEYVFRSYLAQNVTDVDGIFGYEFVFSRHGHFRDGTGFHIYGNDPATTALIGSWINGVHTGDTTFVYSTSIETPDELPREIRLSSYPNPFNPSATISFDLPNAAHTTLRVVDLHGRVAALLVDEVRSSGSYQVVFEAAHLSSGLYLIELSSSGVRTVRKVTLMK